MSGIVHVAGPPVAGVAQFCSRCGFTLLDEEGKVYAVPVGQEPWSPSFWPEGAMILRDGPMTCVVEAVEPDESSCSA